jgi:hypothetical protein
MGRSVRLQHLAAILLLDRKPRKLREFLVNGDMRKEYRLNVIQALLFQVCWLLIRYQRVANSNSNVIALFIRPVPESIWVSRNDLSH